MKIWDALRPNGDRLHSAELVSSLRSGDPVHSETALHIIDDPEVFSSLIDLDNIHEASGELWIRSCLPIDLDEALLHDSLHLFHVQSVLQTIPEEETNG